MPFTSIEELQLKALLTRNIDMHQRRVINAHDAINPDDYITKRQITSGSVKNESNSANHASTHESGGSDEIDVTGLHGLLGDQQDPLPHAARHYLSGSDEIDIKRLGGFPSSGPDDDFQYLSEGFFSNPLPQGLDTDGTPLFSEVHIENLLAIDSPITTVAGSTSGTAEFSMPFQGSSCKKVIIYGNNLIGDATYVFDIPFTNIPESTIPGFAAFISTMDTLSVTVTGMVAETGFIEIFGY